MRYLILGLSFLLGFSVQAQAQVIQGKGIVNYVVDGDTMDIRVPEAQQQQLLDAQYISAEHISERFQTFRVRLANVDTAESKHLDESRNSATGEASSSYVRGLIIRKPVTYYCFDKGHYGRAICSLDVEGVGDLGLHLIATGHSPYVTGFGRHPMMHDQYLLAERESNTDDEDGRSWRPSDLIKNSSNKTKGLSERIQKATNKWW